MAQHYYNKLDALQLNDYITATEFINSFDQYVREVEEFENEKWKEDKKIIQFKKRIDSTDYDTEKRSCKGTTLDVLIICLREREQELNRTNTESTVRMY